MFKSLKGPAVYAVAIPLALILGYLVSSPDPLNIAGLGIIVLFFAMPLFFQYHHACLIFFWNAAFNAYFLPGGPDFWLIFAVFSLGVSLLNHIMFQTKFINVPALTRPLIFLALVIVLTAMYRGGILVKSLGGTTYGGRYYLVLLGGIAGYFAFTAKQIPIAKSEKMANLFFLSAISYVLGNIVYLLGPSFYNLYYFVQSGVVSGQLAAEEGVSSIERIQGLAQPCVGVMCFLLARYTIRGIFDWSKPWRLLLLMATVGVSAFAGFRSILGLLFLTFAFQFYFEGLYKTRLLPIISIMALCIIMPVLLFSEHMPKVVQRAVSFLPVQVDTEVREDAKGSTEWRTQMWEVVWKDVPKYLVVGKGYSIDPTDMFLTTEGMRLGLLSNYEEAMLAGDYHNGPLSVIVPFGIAGVAGFFWVIGAGGWALYMNFRHGDIRLRRINTVLLSFFCAYTLSFFFIFGAFNSQLFIFLGLVGFSVSLNGGVKRSTISKRKPASVPVVTVLQSK
jgi:hypothetical protein